jgi:hypothetical protein
MSVFGKGGCCEGPGGCAAPILKPQLMERVKQSMAHGLDHLVIERPLGRVCWQGRGAWPWGHSVPYCPGRTAALVLQM